MLLRLLIDKGCKGFEYFDLDYDVMHRDVIKVVMITGARAIAYKSRLYVNCGGALKLPWSCYEYLSCTSTSAIRIILVYTCLW